MGTAQQACSGGMALWAMLAIAVASMACVSADGEHASMASWNVQGLDEQLVRNRLPDSHEVVLLETGSVESLVAKVRKELPNAARGTKPKSHKWRKQVSTQITAHGKRLSKVVAAQKVMNAKLTKVLAAKTAQARKTAAARALIKKSRKSLKDLSAKLMAKKAHAMAKKAHEQEKMIAASKQRIKVAKAKAHNIRIAQQAAFDAKKSAAEAKATAAASAEKAAY